MKTILILAAIIAVISAISYFLTKKGVIKDSDDDFIPDVVEDAVEDVKEEIKEEVAEAKAKVKAKAKKAKATAKKRVAKAKEELGDVADALKGIPVIEGKVTKTKLRELSKEDLTALADKKFDMTFEEGVTKTNMVNRVYELYYPNKK